MPTSKQPTTRPLRTPKRPPGVTPESMIEALKKADACLRRRQASTPYDDLGICAAIFRTSGHSPTSFYLRRFISRQLRPYPYLSTWLERNGVPTAGFRWGVPQLQKTRRAWVRWMIRQLKAEIAGRTASQPVAWRVECKWRDPARDQAWRKYEDYGTRKAAESSHQTFANPGDIEARIVPLYAGTPEEPR